MRTVGESFEEKLAKNRIGRTTRRISTDDGGELLWPLKDGERSTRDGERSRIHTGDNKDLWESLTEPLGTETGELDEVLKSIGWWGYFRLAEFRCLRLSCKVNRGEEALT